MGIDLTLRHLRAVVAIADAGGYTAAAQRLQIAQSSLSRTVQEVEHRVGVRLFERTTRRVGLTLEGEEFLGIARRLVDEFDAATNHFEGYLAGTRGSVSVAALPSLAATLLPPLLATYRRDHPEVAVTVRDGFSEEVVGLVERGEVDFAITAATTLPERLWVRHVAVDRFSCVLPTGHRLAKWGEVPWTKMRDEPFVAFEGISSIRRYTDWALSEVGVRPGPVTEARNIGAVAGLVAAGLGISAVPGLVLPMMQFADLMHRPLVAPTVERDICLVRDPYRPLSRAGAALIRLLASAEGRGVDLPDGVRWTDAAA